MPPRTFGHDAQDREGRKVELTRGGHLLEVLIHRGPGVSQADLRERFVETSALIDTGASDVCIDYRIADSLGLRLIDQRTVGTLGGPVPARVYLGILEIPVLDYKELMPLYAFRVRQVNFSVILGRSFLADYIATFDGPNGCCHLVRASEAYPPPPDDE